MSLCCSVLQCVAVCCGVLQCVGLYGILISKGSCIVVRDNDSGDRHEMKESCYTYKWVMSHIQMSHVTRKTESFDTYNKWIRYVMWVMSRIRKIRVTDTNESCHTYKQDLTDLFIVLRDNGLCDSLIHASYVWVWHDFLVRVTRLICARDMTHSYAWYDLFIRVKWLMWKVRVNDSKLGMWDMTYAYVFHDSFVRATWLMRTRGMTYSCVGNDLCDRFVSSIRASCV